jgi:hypothetical protein
VLASEPPPLDEPFEAPTEAEDYVHRALTAALLGVAFPPVLLYVAYLLVRYAGVAGGASPATRRRAAWAAVFVALFGAPWAAVAVLV